MCLLLYLSQKVNVEYGLMNVEPEHPPAELLDVYVLLCRSVENGFDIIRLRVCAA